MGHEYHRQSALDLLVKPFSISEKRLSFPLLPPPPPLPPFPSFSLFLLGTDTVALPWLRPTLSFQITAASPPQSGSAASIPSRH